MSTCALQLKKELEARHVKKKEALDGAAQVKKKEEAAAKKADVERKVQERHELANALLRIWTRVATVCRPSYPSAKS